MFQFKPYQHSDLTRAAMHDGAIIAWDPGLGKTIAMFTWPILKNSRRTLIVAPASLHNQIIKEGKEKFHVSVTTIRDQASALALIASGKLSHQVPASVVSPTDDSIHLPEFFITDYRWLGYNGADCWPTVDSSEKAAHLDDDEDTDRPTASYKAVITNPLHALRLHTADKLHEIAFDPSNYAGVGSQRRYSVPDQHDGQMITCIHRPTLSLVLREAFDCVVCDEAVRLKAGISHNANGVLSLDCRYRLALTGTPIKNKLSDFFFLASWVTGYSATPTARWPYASTMAARHEFTATHSIVEENHTRSFASGRRQAKQTNQLCQLHRLWKLLAPVVVRRKKSEVGATIQPKNITPISIQPGTEQQRAYSWILSNPPKHATPLACIGAQLAQLRQAATCPDSSALPIRSTGYTPKMHAILNLCAELIEKGEQVAIFSPFQEFSTTLHGYLDQANVPHALLDGRTAPLKRGVIAAAFKRKEYPILIAGMDSMGEGHSFEQCSHLIMPSITWAYDTNAQAIERVHRLTSDRPVYIYTFITKNTIDEKLQAIFNEKSNSSDLALDGRIGVKQASDINLAELLSSAIDSFDATADTISESSLMFTWPMLRDRLTLAADNMRPSINTPTPESTPEPTTEPEPTIQEITQRAIMLNAQYTSGEITADVFSFELSELMDHCLDTHHLTPEETQAILTATPAPAPAPAPTPSTPSLLNRFPGLAKFATA